MNIEEAIKHIEQMGEYEHFVDEPISKASVLSIVRKIKQPKVTIPQFVADYIDISQFYVRTLHYALENSPEKVNLWLCENELNRQNIFARAWLDGYEVEKEKRYYVRLKNVDENYNFLNFIKHLNAWVLTSIKTDKKFRSTHTRKELEEGDFGWVFDCPGIEIEEVE